MTMAGSGLKLPGWAERLREAYLSGEASQFLVHSNTGDLVPWDDGSGLQYVTMIEFLTRFLARTKEVVALYNLSQGLSFVGPDMREKFTRSLNARRAARGEPQWSGVSPADPSRVLALLGELISMRHGRAAVVIDYLETLAPEGDISYLSSEDRACVVAVQEWSRDPDFLASDNIVVMVAENLMEVNRKVRSSPQIKSIEAGLPGRRERLRFISHVSQRYKAAGASPELLADVTGGLTRIQIEEMFKNAAESGGEVSADAVSSRKKEVIERECMGLVEVIEPGHGFESIGGMDRVKEELDGVARALKRGEWRRTPMGILLTGPMGTGKSFLAEAFAKESGLTCVKLKSFRDKWVGSTEANLERILSIIEAMGHVLVVVDEADRNLAPRSGEGDSGTESRVIARLKEFMGDGSHRGRIIFMVITNRPDRLDVDLKRPGRLDLKVPVFYPDTDDQRKEIIRALARKNGYELGDADLGEVCRQTRGFSGADLEGLLGAADRMASQKGAGTIARDHLEEALRDFIPSRDSLRIEYMELVAAFESSSKSLLPEKYRQMTDEEMREKIMSLRNPASQR